MFDLISHLWPQFALVLTPGLEMEEIAVWIWLFMMIIMAISVMSVIRHWLHFSRRLKRVQQLIQGQDRNSLAQNRLVTLEKALEQDRVVTGPLWREFDESLVYSADKSRLFNTLEAEHFFNNYTLAYGLTSSRLLAAAPAFLTAIGVLGTFLGLTLGLKGLQINAGDVETLKDGISVMINGAAVAFMTSIWGVALSLLLNVFEKLVERKALAKIRDLQQRIDYLYPRLPAEHSLVQIAAATEESKEALQELHERIGDRLQETVSGMSDSMQQAFTDAINTVMAPAIQSLVNNTNQQSTDVLEKLVSGFMDGMKTAGSDQSHLMKNAAEEVQQAVSGMAGRMEALFKQLDEQQSRTREQTEGTSREFAQLLEQQGADAAQRQQQMEQRFNQLMEQMEHKVSAQFDKSSEDERKRAATQEHLHTQMVAGFQSQLEQFNSASSGQIQAINEASAKQQSEMGQTFESALGGLQTLISSQAAAASERESVIESRFNSQLERLAAEQQQLLSAVTQGAQQTQQQMLELTKQHQQLMTEMGEVSRSVEVSSQHMNNSSTQLGLLSANLKQAADVLDSRLQAVTETLAGASDQNRELAEQVSLQADTLRQLQAELTTATQHFEKAAVAAEQGFEVFANHQQQFLQGINTEFQGLGQALKEQVGGIEQQADEWLRSYSTEVRTQVGERMEHWNKNTLEFADQMRRTVNAISGIVDDLEQKV
ncbi:anti-phage ZorAB system protein ZorA [Vreelandella titanicae]|uniref:anti-phage ZorAB system protein ZorA n=1 Tax=Vreelandella titanicae TaxID=664683 RepID=UPI003D011C4E|tara:strand:- start:8822 stop:10957 length:2136 start_codon:yes stop_codon:yes gene_type:complete